MEYICDKFRIKFKGEEYEFPKCTLIKEQNRYFIKERYTHPFLVEINKPHQEISIPENLPLEIVSRLLGQIFDEVSNPRPITNPEFERFKV